VIGALEPVVLVGLVLLVLMMEEQGAVTQMQQAQTGKWTWAWDYGRQEPLAASVLCLPTCK